MMRPFADKRPFGPFIKIIDDENENLPDEFEEEIKFIQEETTLSLRESQVYVLKTRGFTHEEIGNILNIKTSTVDEFNRRIKQKFRQASNTVENLDDIWN